MNEIIRITESNGRKAVSARELYDALGLEKSQWKRWYTTNISGNQFAIEFQDYEGFDIMANGNATKDFALSIDFAKRICMLSRTEKGEEIRNYFLECERMAQSTKTLSLSQQILLQAQMNVQIEERLSQQEEKLAEIEAKVTTRPEWYAISGFAALSKIHIDMRTAAQLGRKASALCKRLGLNPGSTHDPRFGIVGTYPVHVLREVFHR